jgi:membrane associated rhomboid family serine protease
MAVAKTLRVPALLVLAAAAVTASAALTRWAVLDSSQVLSGDLWRLLTGHLAHLTWMQLAVDGPAFILLWALYRSMTDDRAVVQLTLGSALVVSLTVMIVNRHALYGGLSGLSSALLSAILLTALLRDPRSIMPYLLAGTSLIYLLAGDGVADVPVAREAHIAGAASGFSVALFRFMLAVDTPLHAVPRAGGWRRYTYFS